MCICNICVNYDAYRSITLYGLKPFTQYRIIVRGIYIGVITESGEVTTSNGINATTTATTAEDCKVYVGHE